MAKRLLHYFDTNGRGESIRYILHYGQVEFEDVRYEYEKWSEQKSFAPYGKLPVYDDGDHGTLNQSLAIARYIGQSLNLGGGDPFKDAQIDAMALTIDDLLTKWEPIYEIKNIEAREAALNVYKGETIDYYFSRFEKQIKENNGFFFGKLTWVDFVLVGVVECFNLYLEITLEARYPSVKALMEKIYSYPGVKKYIDARTPYVPYPTTN